MAVRIQFRRGTAAEWTSYNPILYPGEFGHETDTRLFKIGDGSTRWNSLPYAASTITQVTAGTGLTGGGTGGNVTVAVDTSQVLTGVTAGTGLTGGGTGGNKTLSVDTTQIMTGVTAGTGLTGGGTGGNKTLSIDPTVVLRATEFDAKGDMLVGTGSDTFARLPVGTTGYYLTADNTTATGLAWTAVTTPNVSGKAIALSLVFA